MLPNWVRPPARLISSAAVSLRLVNEKLPGYNTSPPIFTTPIDSWFKTDNTTILSLAASSNDFVPAFNSGDTDNL